MSSNSDEYIRQMRRRQGYMPIGEHLEELRWRFFRSLIWVIFFGVGAFFFYEEVWKFVMAPIAPLIEEATSQQRVVKLIVNRLPDFFLIQFKLIFMVGIILAAPFWVFEIWGFLVPALGKALKRWGYALLIFAVFLFWGGAFFAREMIWPLVVHFFVFGWESANAIDIPGITQKITLKPDLHLTIGDYLSFFFGFHFAFGISFQLPVVCIIFALLELLSAKVYFRFWRYAILIIAMSSAILTPPDPFSMIAMMIPLIFLYLFSGVLIFLINRRLFLKKSK